MTQHDTPKRRARTAVILAALVLAASSPAHATVPPIINFQGRMLDSGGMPEIGILAVGFALYNAPTGGSPLWSETQTIAFGEGFYSVMLGSVSSLPASVLGDPLYVSVTVAGDELVPRMQVASVAFALRAAVAEVLDAAATGTGSGLDADSLDGLDATDFAAATHSHPAGDAETLDGLDATDFAAATHSHPAGDADTLDGIDSSGFALSSHNHDVAYVNASGDTVSGNLSVTGSLSVGGDTVWDEGSLRFTLCTHQWSMLAVGYYDWTFTGGECTNGVPTGTCIAAMRRADCGSGLPMVEQRCNNNGTFHHYRPSFVDWCAGSCLYICQ